MKFGLGRPLKDHSYPPGPLNQPSQEVVLKVPGIDWTDRSGPQEVRLINLTHFVQRPRRGQEVFAGREGETHYASQTTGARYFAVRDALTRADGENAASRSRRSGLLPSRFRYQPETVISRLFELAAFCGDLRAEAAIERGAAAALRGQLIETRQEMATLQASGMGAGRGGALAGPAGSGDVDVGGTRGRDIAEIPPAVPGAALSYAAALTGSGPGTAAQARVPRVGVSGNAGPTSGSRTPGVPDTIGTNDNAST
ncbi:hypothetical protein MRX96_020711 [Rhipicephalus microplus]